MTALHRIALLIAVAILPGSLTPAAGIHPAEDAGSEAVAAARATSEDAGSEAASRLVDQLVSAAAGDRVRALRQVVEAGPPALPALRRALESAADDALRRAIRRAIIWIRAREIIPLLEAGLETMLTFDGQYADLARFGEEGLEALVAIVDDSSSDIMVRIAAARAIADVGGKALLPRLRVLQSDILMPQALREQLGVLLAVFGDTHVIARDLEEYTKHSRSQQLNIRVSAFIQLANLYYRIRDYKKAVECYEEIISIYEDLLDRQGNLEAGSQVMEALREQLTIHYYNAACSNCLHGDIETCKMFLRKAVERDPTHFESIEKDGDLIRLRADPSYREFREELGRLFEGKQL